MSANSAAFDHLTGFRWRQGDPSLADAEAQLYDLGVLRSVLEEAVEIAVADARADGVTWARIGDALGVTHRSEERRVGKECRSRWEREEANKRATDLVRDIR